VNKPLTYWIDTDHIHELCDRFGPTLDGYEEKPGLTNREKISLRCVLSSWVCFREWVEEIPLSEASTLVKTAWATTEISEYGVCSSDVGEALNILEGITVWQANEIIRALSEAIKQS
jgi:hypothetical protein